MSENTSPTMPTMVGTWPAAIVEFHGPTNYRGSRYIATIRWDADTTFRVTWDYRHELDSRDNVTAAAAAVYGKLRDSLELGADDARVMIVADGGHGRGYVVTFVPAYALASGDVR
jgi:hypothetical protein